jgi:hypothetical protein
MPNTTEIRVTCKCKTWHESAYQIFHAQVQHTLVSGERYTGKGFKYCPWCGRLLTQREPDKKSTSVNP